MYVLSYIHAVLILWLCASTTALISFPSTSSEHRVYQTYWLRVKAFRQVCVYASPGVVERPNTKDKRGQQMAPIVPPHMSPANVNMFPCQLDCRHTAQSPLPTTACQRPALDTHCHYLSSDTANTPYLMGMWQANYKLSWEAVESLQCLSCSS